MPKPRAWTLSGTFSSHELNKLVLLLICHGNAGAAVDIDFLLIMKIFCNVIKFSKKHRAQIFLSLTNFKVRNINGEISVLY